MWSFMVECLRPYLCEILQWHQFDPQLDTSGTEIIGRIVRISSIVGRSVDKNLDRFQMTVGEFDVLAALAREKKQELTPKQLQDLILISSGGLTNRIDQLEKKGLIERSPNPNDRRSLFVGYFRNIVIRDDTNFLITTDAKNRAEARFF